MKITLAFKHIIENDAPLFWKLSAESIKYWDSSKYFHIEIIIKDKWIYSGTEGGIIITELKPLTDKNYDYYDLTTPNLTTEQEKILFDYIESQKGSGYDWLGIFLSQILPFDRESSDKWFCSEIVAKLLQMMYVEEFLDKKPNTLSPADIFNIIKPKLIWRFI